MSKTQETIKYYLDTIDTLFKEDDWFEKLSDFLGTGICDGFCCGLYGTNDCTKVCSLFHAMSTLKSEPTIENLNEVKSLVSQRLHNELGG